MDWKSLGEVMSKHHLFKKDICKSTVQYTDDRPE